MCAIIVIRQQVTRAHIRINDTQSIENITQTHDSFQALIFKRRLLTSIREHDSVHQFDLGSKQVNCVLEKKGKLNGIHVMLRITCIVILSICFIVAIIFIALLIIYPSSSGCKPSITTASGFVVSGEICAGNLIFEENFDRLDKYKWRPEVTFGGGGVSISRANRKFKDKPKKNITVLIDPN